MCNVYTDVQAPSRSGTLPTAPVCLKVANLKQEGRGKQRDERPRAACSGWRLASTATGRWVFSSPSREDPSVSPLSSCSLGEHQRADPWPPASGINTNITDTSPRGPRTACAGGGSLKAQSPLPAWGGVWERGCPGTGLPKCREVIISSRGTGDPQSSKLFTPCPLPPGTEKARWTRQTVSRGSPWTDPEPVNEGSGDPPREPLELGGGSPRACGLRR